MIFDLRAVSVWVVVTSGSVAFLCVGCVATPQWDALARRLAQLVSRGTDSVTHAGTRARIQLVRCRALTIADAPACSGIENVICRTRWGVRALTAAAVAIINLCPWTRLNWWAFTLTRVVAESFWRGALLNPCTLTLAGSRVEDFAFGARLGLATEAAARSEVKVLVGRTFQYNWARTLAGLGIEDFWLRALLLGIWATTLADIVIEYFRFGAWRLVRTFALASYFVEQLSFGTR